jgi:phage terminase large subunit-like protein
MMTRGDRVIAFIEQLCRTPEGAHVGKPMVLAEFQKQFIREIYDNPTGTRRAYLSIARKNGKSGLIAGILLAHLVGPEAQPNSQIVSGARSRDQAALVFGLAAKMVSLSPDLQKVVRIVPSGKRLIGLPRNVEYRALAADGTTAHGLSPVLAILDEVGQVRGPQDDFIDAITTSQGAHAAPLLIAISTQAPTDADLFSIWLDDAKSSKDPKIVCHVYEAEPGCDVMDEAGWKSANPALGLFRSLDDLREQAIQAHRMPATENSFRNLILNQRVEARSPFVSRSVWTACGAEPPAMDARTPVYCGLDLSSVNDLTAFVMVAQHKQTWGVHPTFWLPAEGLSERARNDRVPYDVWAKQGFMKTTPGASIEYEFVAAFLREVFTKHNVIAVGFDRYNMRFLKPWLEKAGFSVRELEKFVEFGQGYISMSPALRELESLLLNKKLSHGGHPVLTMCAQNATVQTDAAENRKFVKAKASGRIDGMVALAMAIGVMPNQQAEALPSIYERRGILTV